MSTESVYVFKYCCSIHESGYAAVSLHRKKENAEKAQNDFLKAEYKNHKEVARFDNEEILDFDKWIEEKKKLEDWLVEPMEIQD